jgi:hypothetical protein
MAKKKEPADLAHTPCCGQCEFFHKVTESSRDFGCYVDPPTYLYGEADVAEYEDHKPTKSTRPACGKFKPANGGH